MEGPSAATLFQGAEFLDGIVLHQVGFPMLAVFMFQGALLPLGNEIPKERLGHPRNCFPKQNWIPQ